MSGCTSELGSPDGGPFIAVGPDGVAVAHRADGRLQAAELVPGQTTAACLRLDSRGLVLDIARGESVHVNGRPVREKALLRNGDMIVVGRGSHLVRAIDVPKPCGALLGSGPGAATGFPRVWLRCIGGRRAGQVRSLESGGSLPWSGERGVLAQVAIDGHRLVAHATRPGSLAVDGHLVADCILHGGEQLVVGDDRWVVECVGGSFEALPVVEVPTASPVAAGASMVPSEPVPDPTGNSRFSPLWLIAAAIGVATALAALLWSIR